MKYVKKYSTLVMVIYKLNSKIYLKYIRIFQSIHALRFTSLVAYSINNVCFNVISIWLELFKQHTRTQIEKSRREAYSPKNHICLLYKCCKCFRTEK